MADQNTVRSERRLWLQDAYGAGGGDHDEGHGFAHPELSPSCRTYRPARERRSEIATYRALVIAAERAAAPDIAAVCGQILQEEIAMARWLEDHQDSLVGAFLNRDETPGAQAKR